MIKLRVYHLNDESLLLSPREAEVLTLLIDASGRPVPGKAIEQRILGAQTTVPGRAARTYVERLRRRLRAQGSKLAERIVSIYGRGYILLPNGFDPAEDAKA